MYMLLVLTVISSDVIEQGSLDSHFALNTDIIFLDVRVEIPRGPTLTLNSLKECNVVNHTL